MARTRVLIELGDGGILGIKATDVDMDVIILDHDVDGDTEFSNYAIDGMTVQRVIQEPDLLTAADGDVLSDPTSTFFGAPAEEVQ